MSFVTSGQRSPIANGRHYDATTGRSSQPKQMLHSVDLATWDDGDWADPFFAESGPVELDEPWPYRFTSGQRVWICASNGKWYPGKVVGRAKSGTTRAAEGLFWCAEFLMGSCRVRKWFAPLNGDIKPDFEHTHMLLSEAGWLESDSDE